MAIAPLIVRIRALGAAALSRTSAALRAFGASLRAQAARFAAAARSGATYTAMLHRLGTALRRVAVVARIAAAAIGGALVRALRAAGRAAVQLAGTLATLGMQWAAIGTIALGVAVPLVPVIGNLLGAVQLLAPAIVSVVAAFATWKFATRGFADAVRADSAEELTEALKKLSPSARYAALTLRDLGREWKSTQQKVQEAFFKGARADFIRLSRAIQGVADKWLPKLAQAFAETRMAMTTAFTNAVDSGQLDKIMAGVEGFLRGLLYSVPYLIQALLDVAEVAAPSFAALGEGIQNTAMRFAEWIRAMKDSGKLAEWLDKAKATLGQLKEIGSEIGRVFKAIFQGAEGNDFLTNLKNSISELADWLESEDGQAVIDFFVGVGEAAANLIVTISNVVTWFTNGIEQLRDIVQGGQNALTTAFGFIGGAATAMFTVINGGVNAFNWIGGVVGRLGGLVTSVQGAVRAINTALAAIRTTVFIDIITRRFDGSKGYAKGIGGGGGGGGLKYYAQGGRVSAGVPVVVGDGGRPELFVPDSAGRILPRVPDAAAGRPWAAGRAPSAGASATSWSGSMSGLDAMFFRWLQEATRTGKLKLA